MINLADMKQEVERLEHCIIYTPRNEDERDDAVENLRYSRSVGDLQGIQLSMTQITQADRLTYLKQEIAIAEENINAGLSNSDFAEIADILSVPQLGQ